VTRWPWQPEPAPEPELGASSIAAELQRQVDHQIAAADSIDTRGTALLAGLGALTGLVLPRFGLATDSDIRIPAVTLGLLVGTLGALLRAIRPRAGGFSYGPDPELLVAHVRRSKNVVDAAIADSLAGVRDRNEKALQQKGGTLVLAMGLFVAATIGVAAMAGGGMLHAQ
jgi:hypothetical protein